MCNKHENSLTSNARQTPETIRAGRASHTKASREGPVYNTKRATYSEQQNINPELPKTKRATYSQEQNRDPERPRTHYAVPSGKSQQSHCVLCVHYPGCTYGIKLNVGDKHKHEDSANGEWAPYTSDQEDNYPIPGGQFV